MSNFTHIRQRQARWAQTRRHPTRPATDSELTPEAALIIAVFRRARLDLFSASRNIRLEAAQFLAEHGFNIEQIKATWQAKS